MSARERLGYSLLAAGAKVLPKNNRERLMRTLATGDPQEYVVVDDVVLPDPPAVPVVGVHDKEAER